MRGELIAQGLELMLFGMGAVLLFLTLLVLATALMTRVIVRFFPELPPAHGPGPGAQQEAVADPRQIAAITAAVHRYRAERG